MIIAILIVVAVLVVVVINSTLQHHGITDHMGDELRASEDREEEEDEHPFARLSPEGIEIDAGPIEGSDMDEELARHPGYYYNGESGWVPMETFLRDH